MDNWFSAENNKQIINSFSSIVKLSEKIKDKKQIEPSENLSEDKKLTEEYLDKYVLHFVELHPNTRFILVFPPYSRMRYAQWAQYDLQKWEIHKHTIKYLASKTKRLKNLEIYGYEDQDFLDDIANYKDLNHYHHSINSKMLDDFQNKDHLISNDNVSEYINKAEEKAKNFDVFDISDRIKKFLDGE